MPVMTECPRQSSARENYRLSALKIGAAKSVKVRYLARLAQFSCVVRPC